MIDWKPAETAPEDRPIAICVQEADESGQQIIPNCMFRFDLGGSYVELSDPENVIHISEQGQFPTYWAEPINMPPVYNLGEQS